jgi:hypothetical protein
MYVHMKRDVADRTFANYKLAVCIMSVCKEIAEAEKKLTENARSN